MEAAEEEEVEEGPLLMISSFVPEFTIHYVITDSEYAKSHFRILE